MSYAALKTAFPDWQVAIVSMVAEGWFLTDALHAVAAALVPVQALV